MTYTRFRLVALIFLSSLERCCSMKFNFLRFSIFFISFFAFMCGTEPDALDNSLSYSELTLQDKEKIKQGSTAAMEFAFDVFKKVHEDKQESNLSFSPHSLFQNLAMISLGCKDSILEEMNKVLHLPEDFSLATFLKNQENTLKSQKGELELESSHSFWLDQNLTAKNTYKAKLQGAMGYEALKTFDPSDKTGSITRINDWVSQKTQGKITSIIDTIQDNHKFLALSTLWFKAQWFYKFDKKDTVDNQDFYLLDNDDDSKTVKVSMMDQTSRFPVYEGDTFKAVDMPYKGKNFSMLVVLPHKGSFLDYGKNLSKTSFLELLEKMTVEDVWLQLPKFKLQSKEINFDETIKSLGMVSAFESSSDFSGMVEDDQTLSLQNVSQKTYLEIDEVGTEAAVVTKSEGIGCSAPLTVNFKVNRPFYYFIYEKATQSIFLMGQITKP